MKAQLCLVLALVSGILAKDGAPYYGKFIGAVKTDSIQGDVYAVDARTLFIKAFTFDGRTPDAVFYGGASPKVGPDGFVIPLERATAYNLNRAYNGEDITLTLPEGRTLKEVRWIALWSQGSKQALSSVQIPVGFEYPRPQRLSALSGQHQVKSDRVYIVDAQTFLIPNFTYDGQAPDAFFWVGRGSKPNKDGIKIPNESGKLEPLRRYDSKTVVITLPAEMTVFDIGYLSVYCRAFEVNFGHIRIPDKLNVPPSLKMLGVAPQAKLNCEVLWDDLALEVRWAVAGETIVLQLVGKLEDRQYIAFGPSGDPGRTRMVGGDVSIGWLDRSTGKGFVHDYYMTSKSQCSGGRGVCKDSVQPNGANNIRLLNAALVNDYVMLTYQRPLKASDEFDRSIITNGTQAVIWAIGPLDEDNEPSYHRLRNRGDLLIDFGRNPEWNCPAPEELPAPLTKEVQPEEREIQQPRVPPPPQPAQKTTVAPPPVKPRPWSVPPIECHEPENKVFYAHIGPNGGDQGYSAITGRTGWGISWYINGLLIPEIHVVRGETYTFVVEGGEDPERAARFHPFYISDDPVGGFESRTPAERSKIRIFAGVTADREGNPEPVAAGRYCEWVADPARPANTFTSFGAFQRSLKLSCEDGEASTLEWTPDENTPDTVYYNCYTHKNLGWRIRVVDRCDKLANRRADTLVAPPAPVPTPAPVPAKKPEPVKPAQPEERGSPDDYESDYYDDEDPAGPKSDVAVGSSQNSVVKANRLPEPGTIDVNKEFAKFPSSFDDLFGGQPFGDPEIPTGKFPSSGGRIPPHAFEKQPPVQDKPNRNLPRYPEDIDDRNVRVPGPPQDQISQGLPKYGPQPPKQGEQDPARVKSGPPRAPVGPQQPQEPNYGPREPQQPKEVSNGPRPTPVQSQGPQQLPIQAQQPYGAPQQSGPVPAYPYEPTRQAQQPAQQPLRPEGAPRDPQQQVRQPQQPHFGPQQIESDPQQHEEAGHDSQQPPLRVQRPTGEQPQPVVQSFGPQQPPRQLQQPLNPQQQPNKPIHGFQEPPRQVQQPGNPSFGLQEPLKQQQQPLVQQQQLGKPSFGLQEPPTQPQQPEKPTFGFQEPPRQPQQPQNGPQQPIRRPQQPVEVFPGPQFQQPERQQPSAQQAPPLQRQQLEKQQLLQAMQNGASVPPKLKTNPKVNFPAPSPPEEIFQRFPGDEFRRQQTPNVQNVPDNRAPAFTSTGIIMEGGFKPIKKSDGIIPALGFEVETVGSHGYSLPTTIRSEAVNPNQKPGLVNLDPVFVPSEPEAKEDPKNPVAVPLPIPVVPVVPLGPQGQKPPQPLPHQLQQQRPRQPPPPPPIHRLPQPVPVAIPRPGPQPKPAQSSGFFSFLKFPTLQRRQQQQQQPGPSQFHVRQQFRPDDSEPQQQQPQPNNPPPRIQQGPQRNPASPQQQPLQPERRPVKPQQLSEPNFQSLPKKPSLFSLEGISRIMGMTADRRQEPGPKKPVNSRPLPEQQRPKPATLSSKNVPYLPQIKPPLGNPLALLSQGPIPNVFAASMMKGGPLMGLPVGGMKVAITEKEKAQLEKFLFGPGNELRRSGQFPNIVKIVPVPEAAKQRDGRLDLSEGQDDTFFDETNEVFAIEVPVADDINNSTQYVILGSISADAADLTTPAELEEETDVTTDELPTTTEIPQDHHVEKRQVAAKDSKPKENRLQPATDIDDDETVTNRTMKAKNSAFTVQQPSLFYLLTITFIYFSYL